MSGVKLKPCPFCGGVAFLGIDYENSEITTMLHDFTYYIKCQACGAVIYGGYGRADIANKWNRRAGERNEID